MSQNFLCLNSDKTEVILTGTPHQINKSGALALTVEGTVLDFQNKLKKLGVIFDINLTFDPHVQNTVKISFFSSPKHRKTPPHVIPSGC